MRESRPGTEFGSAARAVYFALCLLAAFGSAAAQDPNACDEPGDYPDLILGNLDSVGMWTPIDETFAYSIGASTCNLGTCWANWFFNTDQHPVFGENLFRLKDGRFEQIGQAWVTHRFFALSSTLCEQGCLPTNGQHLGVNCSTSNSASVTGGQQYKGPKSEVNASTGAYLFPFTGSGVTGDSIYKRLQVHQQDLEPGPNPGALYFVEGQTVSADDAGAGMQHNNASWRQVNVAPATLNLLMAGPTAQQQPAIFAWAEFDAQVTLTTLDVPDDGRFIVASTATALGGGIWHYEYAIQNLDSHRSAMSVVVPVPAGATVENLGFHDVDYHSGEIYDGTDWIATVDGASNPNTIGWSTESFDENPNANALRWGTLYNFRFDAAAPPISGELALGLFRPGAPSQISAQAVVPALCDNDLLCETGESPCNCAGDCGAADEVESSCVDTLDNDCDGLIDCADGECCGNAPCPAADLDADAHLACEDCDDDAPSVWAVPGSVAGLVLDRDLQQRAILHWNAPVDPGGLQLEYEKIRSPQADDFVTNAVCFGGGIPTATTAVDPLVPAPGSLFHYLVRATNACPFGTGPVGEASSGSTRTTVVCNSP